MCSVSLFGKYCKWLINYNAYPVCKSENRLFIIGDNLTNYSAQDLLEKKIFTGVSGTSMIRLLAPLVLSVDDAAIFVQALKEVLNA